MKQYGEVALEVSSCYTYDTTGKSRGWHTELPRAKPFVELQSRQHSSENRLLQTKMLVIILKVITKKITQKAEKEQGVEIIF